MRRLLSGALIAGLLWAASAAAQAGDERGELILAAERFLREDDGIAAEAKLRAALDRGAPRRAVAAWMGEALLAQGKPRRAARWLRAGDFSPSSAATGFRALGRLERSEGNLRAAGRAYDRALELTPDDAGLWTEIGRLRYAGGEHTLAIAAADHAYALAPGDPAALLLKGQLVRDSRGMVPALPYFEKAYEFAPRDLLIIGELAATVGELGDAPRMLALTRAMLELDPGNPRAFYLQAVMAARAGNYALARSVLARTEAKLDEVPGKLLLEGVVEIGAGNHALAAGALDKLVRKQPGNLRARDLLARALFFSGEYTYLIERFAKPAAESGTSRYLQTLVGRAFEQLDQRERAAPFLNLAAARRGAAVEVRGDGTEIGELLVTGRIEDARTLAAMSLRKNSGNFDNLAAAGDVALIGGDARKAAVHYRGAAQIRQTDALMQRRFQALLIAGQVQEAAAMSATYLADNPASPAAIRAAAWLAARNGDWPRARMLYEVLAARGHGRDVQFLTDLAMVETQLGEDERAVAAAHRAYRLQRASPLAAQALGVTLVNARKTPETARALLDKARAIMGDNPVLAQARLKLAGVG